MFLLVAVSPMRNFYRTLFSTNYDNEFFPVSRPTPETLF